MNRINLKELSDILLKEVEKGNGDAYLFVGEYYPTKDVHPESENKESFIVYTDTYNKEKVAALSYVHVQKLTDDENLELTKRLELDKKSNKYKKADDYGFRSNGSNYYSRSRQENDQTYREFIEEQQQDYLIEEPPIAQRPAEEIPVVERTGEINDAGSLGGSVLFPKSSKKEKRNYTFEPTTLYMPMSKGKSKA
jgi:hypothetical protein